jgi:glycine cleavage system aminomethyltransferase T
MLKKGIGVGYLQNPEKLFDGAPVAVEVHGKQAKGMVYPLPFYKRKKVIK